MKSFATEVCDLEKTKKELDWLFELFRERNYDLVRSNWQFPQYPEMVFSKPLNRDPKMSQWKDVWVIRLTPLNTAENAKESTAKFISAVLIN